MAFAMKSLRSYVDRAGEELMRLENELSAHDPMRQLRLGYSILSSGTAVLRSVAGLKKGDVFHARLSDGTLEARIEDIEKK
jgi:exonuclease VII large subunit